MTPQYILKASLCREPHCGNYSIQSRISEIENMNFANEYAEPGYTNPAKCILFANWNYFASGIDSILESYGYSIEWSDEWSNCETCNKAFRTSPDSMCWQPAGGIVDDCTMLCNDCMQKEAN